MPLLTVGSSCSLHFPGIWNIAVEQVLTAHSGSCPPCNKRSCKGANQNIFSTGPRSPPAETLHSGLHYKGLCTSIPSGSCHSSRGPCEYLGTYSPGGRRPILKTSQFCPRQIHWLGTKRSHERSYFFTSESWQAYSSILHDLCRFIKIFDWLLEIILPEGSLRM